MGNFTTYFVLWGILALVIIGLAVYRKMVASKEDDTIHLSAGESAISQQSAIAEQLAAIDRWGKILTVIAVVAGLVLGGLYLYQVWVNQARTIAQ
jgi:hypothetical protein